jgi:hypothetical protein
MNYQIKINGEYLTIQLESQSFETEITAFLAIRKHSDNCSDKFLHLAERYLNIPLDFFYELAKKINQLLPNNKINWLNTFMFISKIKYDHELNSLNQDDFEEDDNFSHALEDDEVEKELSNPSLFNAFKEGVIQRLIKEGLITDSTH